MARQRVLRPLMVRSVIQSITAREAVRFRRKRFALFRTLVSALARPIRILDVGGEQQFWEKMGFAEEANIEIVLLNVKYLPVDRPNFRFVLGDAANMAAFRDGEFDVVFSNSVIEHLGDYARQRRMAEEVRRVGQRYVLQTPNRHFPVEPHFLFPFFQFMPMRMRVLMLTRFGVGWHDREPVRSRAEETIRSIRLLTLRELRELFPNARIWRERFLGLTKSFVVFGGWECYPWELRG